MNQKTFNQWNEMGHSVLKGSRATWVDGVAMFSEEQTRKKTFSNDYRYRDSWEGATDENCAGGPMYGIYGNCD